MRKPLQCTACGKFGHTPANKKCPMHPIHAKNGRTEKSSSAFEAKSESAVHATPAVTLDILPQTGEVSDMAVPIAALPAAAISVGLPSTTPTLSVAYASEGSGQSHGSLKLVVKLPAGEGISLADQPDKRRRSRSSTESRRKTVPAIQAIPTPPKPVNRRRGDPRRRLNYLLTHVVDVLLTKDIHGIFREAVTDKIAPGYSSIVKSPMYLNRLLQSCKEDKYTSIEAFKNDLQLLVINSQLYNGPEHSITKAAEDVVSAAHDVLSQVRLISKPIVIVLVET